MVKWLRLFGSALLIAVTALFWVQSASGLPHWLANIGLNHHEELIRVLLILCGAASLVGVALLLAGPERVRRVMEAIRGTGGGGVHHHYEKGVTVQQFAGVAPNAAAVRPRPHGDHVSTRAHRTSCWSCDPGICRSSSPRRTVRRSSSGIRFAM